MENEKFDDFSGSQEEEVIFSKTPMPPKTLKEIDQLISEITDTAIKRGLDPIKRDDSIAVLRKSLIRQVELASNDKFEKTIFKLANAFAQTIKQTLDNRHKLPETEEYMYTLMTALGLLEAEDFIKINIKN